MRVLNCVIAAFCGAFAFGWVANNFLPGNLWWLGAAAGALIGWIVYSPRAFWQTFTKAVSVVWNELGLPGSQKTVYPQYVKDVQLWEGFVTGTVLASLTFYVMPVAVFGMLLFDRPIPPITFLAQLVWIFTPLSFLGGMSSGRSTNVYMGEFVSHAPFISEEVAAYRIARAKRIVRRYNFITAPFTILFLVAKFVRKVAIYTYRATISDGRLVSMVGAVTGGTIGHFVSNQAIVGAVVGAAVAYLAARFANKQIVCESP